MAGVAYLQVTRECNQNCRFCSNPENQETLDYRDALSFIQGFRARGCHGVIFTGGEPTLFPKLAQLIRDAHKAGIAPRIISNGQKLSDPAFLDELIRAGLDHVHLSIHSHREAVQNYLAGNPDSWKNLVLALENCGRRGLTVNINTVINAHNADHLDGIVEWITRRFPFIRHVVWNNLDPRVSRVTEHPDVIPGFQDFEVSLYRAVRLLVQRGITFRVERVPLCYMAEFAEFSTETRKIVKQEAREIAFLDPRRHVRQENFFYSKARDCAACSLDSICAGVYEGDRYYSLAQVFPVFVDPEAVVRRILPTEEETV